VASRAGAARALNQRCNSLLYIMRNINIPSSSAVTGAFAVSAPIAASVAPA